MYEELIERLNRYSEKCIAERLDADFAEAVGEAVKALGKPQWIKFKTRDLDQEEKEEHPDWMWIMDCALPDDGQEVLVSNGRWVCVDTFYSDEDGCYFDGGGDLEEQWWMPLPEPPKQEVE